MKYKIAVEEIHIESSTLMSYILGERNFSITDSDDLLVIYPWLFDISGISRKCDRS